MYNPLRSLSAVLSALREGVHHLFGQPPTAEPRRASTVEAPPEAAELVDEELDELVGLVRGRFGQLSPETRAQIVRTVAATLDGPVEIDDGADVLDTLEGSIRRAGPERTVDAITTLREHVPTIANLRGRYQRAPRIAKGAVEKTAAAAVRAGGVRPEVAGGSVRTLLNMSEDDWALMVETLDEVESRFVVEAS